MNESDEIGHFGIFLRQQGNVFDFIRFYEDGEAYFTQVSSSAPRDVVIDSVRVWFDRDVKPKGKQRELRAYKYEDKGGVITLDRYLNESIRGEFDGYGRFVCVVRKQYPGTKWLPGFSTESLQEYDPVGPPGEAQPVFINAASASALAALPGISKELAANIVEARKEQEFTKVDDLLRVRGFGKKALAACSERCDAKQARRSLLVATSERKPSVSVTSELLEHELSTLLGPLVAGEPTRRTL